MKRSAFVGFVLCGIVSSLPALAERLPVTVRMRVVEHGRSHVREFHGIEGSIRPDGQFAGKVAIGGSDWSAQALVHGQFVIDRSAVTPRGPGAVIQVRGALGLAMGSLGATDFSADVCIDKVFDLQNAQIDLVNVTNVLYGGSVAGAFVDANADLDTPAATLFNEDQDPPMYRLFVDTDTCDVDPDPTPPTPTPSPTPPDTDTSPTNVQVLYDGPQTFSCNGSFCGGNVPEQFFGAPIPSLMGPDIPRSLELRGHYSDGDGDIGVLTAVAAMHGFMPDPGAGTGMTILDLTSGRDLGRATGADLQPRFLLSVSGLNVLGLITLAIDGPEGTSIGQTSESKTSGLPIGPSTLNGGTIVGSLSDFGLPLPIAGTAPVTGRGQLPACSVAQDTTIPIYRAVIDTSEQVFPLYPPPSGPPPFEIVNLFRSIVIAPQSFGGPFTPAPSLIGPQADTELRLEHSFQMSGECVLALASVYVVPQQGVTPTPSNTPTATPSVSPTPSNTPTTTPTATHTATATTTPTPTATATATNTATPSNTPTASNTATATSTPSSTPTASNTPSASSTPTSTSTRTATSTSTATNTPTVTPTRTNTPTPSNTPEISGPVAPAIPTLSGVGLAVLLLLLLGLGVVFLVRARGQS